MKLKGLVEKLGIKKGEENISESRIAGDTSIDTSLEI
jgi:hypothetical protein